MNSFIFTDGTSPPMKVTAACMLTAVAALCLTYPSTSNVTALTTSPFVGQTMQASSTEKPTMATFVRMAEHAPLDLVARVRAGGMSPGLLARAAEAMGKIHDHDTAVPELLILLKNEDIAVQEGAIYGLSQHLTDDVRRTLQELSSDESVHSLIREIAADSLES